MEREYNERLYKDLNIRIYSSANNAKQHTTLFHYSRTLRPKKESELMAQIEPQSTANYLYTHQSIEIPT